MSKFQVQHVRPGPFGLREAIGRFTRRGGLVSAASDAKLRVLKQEVGEDSGVEVVPFGQLVGRFLNIHGEPYGRLATQGQVRALIARACEDLDDESPFRSVARFPGFHRAMQKTLDEIAHADWDEWDLERAADGLDPADAERVRSVVAVRRSIDTMMTELNIERLQDWVRRSLALDRSRNHPFESLVLFGGPDPHPLMRVWAEWAATTGTRVTWVEERFGFVGTEQHDWADAIFTDRVATEGRPAITLQTAADPLAECEWALRAAASAKGSGTFDHRITIVARSSETYAPLLLAAAKRLGVPVDVVLPVPLLTNAFAAWTDRVLRALAGSDVRALLPCVASTYAGLDQGGRAQAELAITEAYREGSEAWPALLHWCGKESETQPWLGYAVGWRNAASGLTLSVGGWHARLRELVVGPVTPTSVFEAGEGTAPTSARDMRAQTAMFRAVAQHALAHDRFGGAGLTLSGFSDLAQNLWTSEEVVLPSDGFGVRFATQSASVGPSDQVIVLGMLEGTFPRRATEDAVLPDDVRAILNREVADKAPLPLAAEIPNAERREFVRLCASAERSLILSHPQTDDSGQIPAFFLEEVERVAEENVHRTVYTRDTLTPADPVLPADRELRLQLAGPKAYPHPAVLQTVSARLAVRAPIESGIRPEELAAAAECPFRSVFRYRLELFPSSRRDPWRRLRRLPRDARLAMAADEFSARSALSVALEEALGQLLGSFEPWELDFFRSTAESWIEGWIRREFDAREYWHEPDDERVGPLAIGDPPLRNAPNIKGERVVLEGRVDALSRIGPYAVIHRFGTSVPEFKLPRDELEYGLLLLTAYHAGEGVAIELDDGSRRTLLLLPRMQSERVRQKAKSDLWLRDVERGEGQTVTAVKKEFAMRVVEATHAVLGQIRSAKAEPRPGAYCRACQYGELCRSSQEYSEVPARFERTEREDGG